MLPSRKTTTRLVDPAVLEIEPIGSHAGYRAAAGELEALEKRLHETQARRQHAQARARNVKPRRSPVERARDLVAGARVPGVDPAAEIAACDTEEFEILRPAIAAARQKLEELRGDLSWEICQRLKAQHDDALREMLRAAELMAAAIAAAAGIRARVHTAGYTPNDTLLPSFIIPAALAIGDPANLGSQAGFYAQLLRDRGIL